MILLFSNSEMPLAPIVRCPVLVLFDYWMQFETFPAVDILIKGVITGTSSPSANLNIFSFHKSIHFQHAHEHLHTAH